MANYETEAIVIGSKNFGDADKIATLFTLSRGKVKAMAYGARRPKNPLAAPLQMFHCIDAELSEGKNLDIVKNASLKERYAKIGEDLTRTAYAMFALEILAEIFPENTQEAEVYELVLEVLRVFEERNPRITANIAAWKFLSMGGFSVSFDVCPMCNEKIDGGLCFSSKEGGFLCEDCNTKDEIKISASAKELLLNLIKFDWNKIGDGFLANGKDLAQSETVLINYLHHILGYSLKSLKFIRQII